MEAPDKCYITREKNGVVYSLSFNDNGGLEYIRKDALLEWADKFRHTSLPGKTIIAYLLDKLNQL